MVRVHYLKVIQCLVYCTIHPSLQHNRNYLPIWLNSIKECQQYQVYCDDIHSFIHTRHK
ncbi:hypothetical protein SAMD00019534_125730, partial [Acytostelium subglobosum LB1]|uniref:hypothetical protein n=1 Tax=Acytostelium subglobosum LB1 TaxID=1410327 RepID=UPI00064519B6